MQLFDDMKNIVTAPFIGSVDLVHVFLLIGLVLVFMAIWLLILGHIRSAAMEIVE